MYNVTNIYKGKRVEVYQGIELKMNINIAAIGDLTMDSYGFTCVAYCSSSKKIVAKKEDCVRSDSDNYMMTVDTSLLTTGDLYIFVLANIPDNDMPDGIRLEPNVIDTGITVLRSPIDIKTL